jgi:hypothetical protein
LDNGSRDVGGVGGGGAECRTARSRVSLRQPLCSCRAPLHSLTSPGNCFYCNQGYTSRCIGGGALLGSAANPGAQAEYLRVPEAEASLFPAPADIKPELLPATSSTTARSTLPRPTAVPSSSPWASAVSPSSLAVDL